jgi:hypothetical protein
VVTNEVGHLVFFGSTAESITDQKIRAYRIARELQNQKIAGSENQLIAEKKYSAGGLGLVD